MKNYIVITGGAGFIGSSLIKFLIKKNIYNIISIDDYSAGSVKNHVLNRKVKYVKGNTKEIEFHLKKYKKKIKVIFHFGEFSRIHQSFESVEKCIDSNCLGTSSVFNYCLKNKIKIIYSATSASLGNKGKDQNLSPYAFTKSKNLKLLMCLNKWFGLSFEVLYFYNVYGPGQIKKGNMATVIGIFEDQFKKKLPLSVVRPGTQKRKFTHINDTIKGCYFAWKKNKNRHYALFNKKSYSIISVAKMFSNKIKYINKKKGERYNSSNVDYVENIKIHKIISKIKLKSYIEEFKKGM